MKRLTSNNTFEMNAVQLALNQVYVSDGWAWYRGGAPEQDVSVCDLIRAAADTLGVELPMLSDAALSDLMADWLQYGVEEPEGVLAILYRALCATAELRDKLSRYEDAGLEPEEIKVILERYHAFRSAISDETGQPMVSWTRAGEICSADKDGRLVVLPVKIGDKIFRLFGGEIEDLLVSNVIYREIGGDACKILVECIPFHRCYWREDFGKTVFQTREEAEAALKKREEAGSEAD